MTTKKELLKHIRGKCLDCCCYQPAEVKLCTSLGCALWPFSAVERPTSPRSGASKNLSRIGTVFGDLRTGDVRNES
jgi:hypothetical protein